MDNKRYINQLTEAAPIAVFRIFFGLLMFLSIIRFWYNGWIEKLYLEPDFHFSYYGFEWVKPIGEWTYLLFIICGLSALSVMLGWKYRWAIVVFFLSFTYIELMDKTTYLNHYYFVSILSFLMIFLPAHYYFSIDEWQHQRRGGTARTHIFRYNIDALRLLMCIVYAYAGLAKLNSDWLLHAQPLQIWLMGKYDIPLLGEFLQWRIFHYLFSWAGAIYDLFIWIFLLYAPTRLLAFVLVIIFHVLTAILFPIGMFPYIMIFSATIFFGADTHLRLLRQLGGALGMSIAYFDRNKLQKSQSIAAITPQVRLPKIALLTTFFAIQLLFPFRYLAYPGELFWTEEGFRFSWRVMLMEKAGYANFKVVDPDTGRRFYVTNGDFLTTFQEKQMSTQPDFILEYAYYLEDFYKKNKDIRDPAIYVESYVALNGRSSQPYVDPDVDLTTIERGWWHRHSTWLMPFGDTIRGL